MTPATIETDYLVIGAGAAGMAFADTLVSESDADVVLVDRRTAPGGHWNDAYPFVRLHQPSLFYGVESAPLGTDRIESEGREAGWYPRATAAEIRSYYSGVLKDRLVPSGRVRFFGGSEVQGGDRVVSLSTGEASDVRVRRKVVDAAYLSPAVPATTPPPFEVGEGADVAPVNDLPERIDGARGFVVVGGGKTALDACVWLLEQNVAPEAITWIKPRECWLLNRAFFQPGALLGDFMRGLAIQMEAAANAESADDLFDRLERGDQFRRVDPTVRPTMFRGATIADWELERLREIRNVIRLGHVNRVERTRIELEGGTIPLPPGHLVVHCAARGLSHPPAIPIFGEDRITLQPVRIGLIPFNAALVGFVEAHRDDDREKNRLCPPNPFPNTEVDWIRGSLIQLAAERAWAEAPDLARWLDGSRLNPTRGVRARSGEPEIAKATGRFVASVGSAVVNLRRLLDAGAS